MQLGGWSLPKAAAAMHERLIQLYKQPPRIGSTRANRASATIPRHPPEQGELLNPKASAGCDSGVVLFGDDDPTPLTAHAYSIAAEQKLKKKPPLVGAMTTGV